MALALFTLVDDSRRSKFYTVAVPDKRQQYLRFYLHMGGREAHRRPGRKLDQPQPALRIGKILAGHSGEPEAPPAIYLPPQPRHLLGLTHPIPDHQVGRSTVRSGKKRGKI